MKEPDDATDAAAAVNDGRIDSNISAAIAIAAIPRRRWWRRPGTRLLCIWFVVMVRVRGIVLGLYGVRTAKVKA